MIERLSSAQLHQGSLDVILDAQARLQRTQEELASGKRILTPSDDPVAAGQIQTIRSELARIETLQKNANHAYNDLAMAESVLDGVQDALQRARDLTVRGGNDALSVSEKQLIANEIDGIRDQILALANSKSAQNEYIFAGYATNEPAFQLNDQTVSYQGDGGVREVNISTSVTVKTRISGSDIFGDENEGVFASLEALATSLRSDDRDGFTAAFQALDVAITNVSDARSTLGVRMNQVSEQQSLNEAFNIQLNDSLGDLEDLDYAKAISEMNLQMVALEAAQQAYTRTQGLSLFNYL